MEREGATLRLENDPYEDLFEQVSQYQVERPNLNALLSVKALVCACNKEKAKENTFSGIRIPDIV